MYLKATFYLNVHPSNSNPGKGARNLTKLYYGDTMLCAGLIKGGKGSCHGDSGGPAVILDNNQATLMGVVSWGAKCAGPQALAVFTEVPKYMDWIMKNMD